MKFVFVEGNGNEINDFYTHLSNSDAVKKIANDKTDSLLKCFSRQALMELLARLNNDWDDEED